MAHTLVVGRTQSGKTSLIKQIAKRAKDNGVGVLVLDPLGLSSQWEADFVTDDPDDFLNTVFNSRRCLVIVDEAGDMIGRYGGTMNKLATRARHLGHSCYFITQRAKQIDSTIRANCANIIIFKQSLADTKDLANEFVDEKINDAHRLDELEYIYKIGHAPARVDKVKF